MKRRLCLEWDTDWEVAVIPTVELLLATANDGGFTSVEVNDPVTATLTTTH